MNLTERDEARFWIKVDKNGPIHPYFPELGNCWVWTKGKTKGYGSFRIGCRTWLSHRISLALSIGGIPEGLDALHSCDNPPCCNPSHLRPGTHQDNMADAVKTGRVATGERSWLFTHPNLHRGEGNGQAKLSETQVREIREKYSLGFTQGCIAREYGVIRQTVSAIICRKLWTHI